MNRLIASIISGSFKEPTCFRICFSLEVRARCSFGFGTGFRTRQTPEKKSNCSNVGTVLVPVPVFILTLVPSLGLGPRLGLVGVVFRFQSQLGTSCRFSFSSSSSCGINQEIEHEPVPDISLA